MKEGWLLQHVTTINNQLLRARTTDTDTDYHYYSSTEDFTMQLLFLVLILACAAFALSTALKVVAPKVPFSRQVFLKKLKATVNIFPTQKNIHCIALFNINNFNPPLFLPGDKGVFHGQHHEQ